MASLLDDLSGIFGGLKKKPTVTDSSGNTTTYKDKLGALKAYAADPANNVQVPNTQLTTMIPQHQLDPNALPETVAAPGVSPDVAGATPLPPTIAAPDVTPAPDTTPTPSPGTLTADPLQAAASGTPSLDTGGGLTTKGKVLGMLLAGAAGAAAGAGQRTFGQGFQQALTLPIELKQKQAQADDLAAQAAQRQAAVANLPVTNQQSADLNAATVAKEQAQAEMYRQLGPIKAQQVQANLANHGLMPATDADGNIHFIDDPNSQIYQQRAVKEQLISAQVGATKAQEELRQAEAAYKQAQADPNSPLFKQAAARLANASRNADAANLRAKAYWGNYQMHAQGVGLDSQPLNGVGMLDGSPVGTTVQQTVNKVLPKAAQMADVNQGLDQLDSSLLALHQSGGSLNDPAMAAAIADPHTTAAQWMQGQVRSTLDPVQRDAVVAAKAMNERIMAMRQSAGGGVSDSQVNRLQAMLPNAATPDYDMGHRQIEQVRQQAAVLSGGIPAIHRKSAPASGGTNPPPAADNGGHPKWFHPIKTTQ